MADFENKLELSDELSLDIRDYSLNHLLEGRQNDHKIVGIYCNYCPRELIIAAGAMPVSLCGTSSDPIVAAEATLPRNLCPLIKSSYGFAITGTCPFFAYSDLVIGETTCDGKKKMFELMEGFKRVYVMQLPSLKGKNRLAMWVNEIRNLASYLEELFSVELTEEKLLEAVILINEETKLLKWICDLNRTDPPVLSGLELLSISSVMGFSGTKKDSNRLLYNTHNHLASLSKSLDKPKGVRVLLTGCPVGIGSEKVVQLVEETGAYVVAMENCSSYKTLELQTDITTNDLLRALAEKTLNIPCSCMSPNKNRLELINRMILDFSVDAVIDLTWQACHTYNIESSFVAKLVRANNLPFLHLESDYSLSDLESLRVRIESLLEMALVAKG